MPGPVVGIDVGKARCHAAILPPGADPHADGAIRLAAPRLELAGRVLAALADGPPATIALELTGNLALPIIEASRPPPTGS
jgi:hypothetical protein